MLERNELRNLQDKVVNKLVKMGYTDDKEKIVNDVTLEHIKTLLLPNYKSMFEDFIAN